jgi:hypothetical protein
MGFPAQFGLLAQGTGFEDWANILIVAVMAVLWLLGALIKTIGKKGSPREQAEQEDSPTERRQPGESWQERLVRKAQEMQRRIEEEAGLREPGKPPRPVRPAARRLPQQAPAGKITVHPGQRGESILVYERPQPQPSTQREHQAARQREAQQAVAAAGQSAATQGPPIKAPVDMGVPKLEPVMEDLSHLMAEPPTPLESGEPARKAPHEAAGLDWATVIDYGDPDALKKVVLHYEILGRPLALRDTPDETSVF